MARYQLVVEMMMMMMMIIVTMMMEHGHSKKPSARCGCSTKVYLRIRCTLVASLTLLGSLAFFALGTCVLQDDLCLVQL